MDERTPQERSIDSGDDRGFDYAGEDLLALPWTEDDEEALLDSRLDRELHEEHERQMAEKEELEEEPRVWTAEEIREDIRELRARPLPPSPEEREAEVEREHEPLTAAEAELLFEHSAGKDLARRARRGDDLLS